MAVMLLARWKQAMARLYIAQLCIATSVNLTNKYRGSTRDATNLKVPFRVIARISLAAMALVVVQEYTLVFSYLHWTISGDLDANWIESMNSVMDVLNRRLHILVTSMFICVFRTIAS